MIYLRNDFCKCKYDKKDGLIDYKTKRKNIIYNFFRKNKYIGIIIILFVGVSVVNIFFILEFFNLLINI